MVLDVLEVAWWAWADAATAFSDDEWRLPTRLPGWTVKDVYAHHAGFPRGLATMAASPAVDGPVTHPDAAALLRMFNAPGGPAQSMADQVRDRAVGYASQRSTAELAAQFTEVAPRTIAAVRDVGVDRLINYSGLAVVPLRQALRIGLLEAVVHYFDVARAVGLPVPGPLDGAPLRETVALLAAVADPVAVVEHATGRASTDPFPVVR
jgi:uncharacterized protein (TIGR03083 family)